MRFHIAYTLHAIADRNRQKKNSKTCKQFWDTLKKKNTTLNLHLIFNGRKFCLAFVKSEIDIRLVRCRFECRH